MENARKAALESNEASLLLKVASLLNALVDDLAEVLLDLLDGHGLGELGEVDLLDLEEVKDVAGRRKRSARRKERREEIDNTNVRD
jgi:hypothetical protein